MNVYQNGRSPSNSQESFFMGGCSLFWGPGVAWHQGLREEACYSVQDRKKYVKEGEWKAMG